MENLSFIYSILFNILLNFFLLSVYFERKQNKKLEEKDRIIKKLEEENKNLKNKII